jgi:GTP-binding protein Era
MKSRQILHLLVITARLASVLAFTIGGKQISRSYRHSIKSLPQDEEPETIINNGKLFEELDSQFDYSGRLKGSDFTDYRCGFISIIGAPNMGKSTLLNALLQEDLCITTARPQTTRHAILGLLTTESCQVCLVDTPGVIATPSYKLQEGMMEAVLGAFRDADVLLVVTDLFSTPIPDDELFAKVRRSGKPTIVVINKIDLASAVNVTAPENQDKSVTVEQAVAIWRQLLPDALAILPCSASHGPNDPGVVALRRLLVGGPGVPESLRELGRPVPGMYAKPDVRFLTDEEAKALLPQSPPLYDQEALTDRTERFIASEIIRSSLFECLNKELPYCCEVQIEEFKEPRDVGTSKPVTRIAASVIVERDSQKLIVIGKKGEKIKEVGTKARAKIEKFLDTSVCTMSSPIQRSNGIHPCIF